MPSPFPGMDPYLEGPTHWSDFHFEYVGELRAKINQLLPEPYAARLGEHVVVEARGLRWPDGRTTVPDVAVVREPGGGAATAVAAVASTPITVPYIELLDDIKETYIEVIRLPEEEIVTAIELLSPTNKYGSGRGDYVRKRRDLMRQGVNLVEIDLLQPAFASSYSGRCRPQTTSSTSGARSSQR